MVKHFYSNTYMPEIYHIAHTLATAAYELVDFYLIHSHIYDEIQNPNNARG